MFDDGVEYLKSWNIARYNDLRELKRPMWSLTVPGSTAKQIELFDSTQENFEWVILDGDPDGGDINKIIGVRNKIAWLIGCRQSLRRQFSCDISDRPRIDADRQRFQYLHHKVCWKALDRMKHILNKERAKKITE